MIQGDPSKDLLREEFSTRVREAVQNRNWSQLEHWAKQWIQFDPQQPEAFKWLARATTALNKIPIAAYAYGRLLDFEAQNEEARNFFTRHPSSLNEQSTRVLNKLEEGDATPKKSFAPVLNPQQRQEVAAMELGLAEKYESLELWSHASERYQQSFEWYPSQLAALGAARALVRSHQGLEAARFLRNQLYYFPNWVEGRLALGRVLAEIGQRADAQREWQAVLQLDPKNKEAFDFLRGLFRENQWPAP